EDRWHATIAEWSGHPLDAALVEAVAPLLRERTARLDQIGPMTAFLFGDDAPAYEPALLAGRLGKDTAVARRVLEAASAALGDIDEAHWDKDTIEAAIRGLEAPLELKLRKFVPALYVAVEGSPQGLPLFDSMVIIGRGRTLHRLRQAVAKLG